MPDQTTHEGKAIVTCSVLRMEMERLASEGLLDAERVIYVRPGSHERPRMMEEDLPRALKEAARNGNEIIVALGRKCYFDFDRPERTIDDLIAEAGVEASRVQAEDCIDMLAGREERETLAAGRRVYWMTPGWVEERANIFEGWDQGKANETFPRHDAALLLDGLDYFNEAGMNDPEKLLDFSDWMGLGLEPAPVELERFKTLLAGAGK